MRLEHEKREWSRIDAAVFRTITSEDWRRQVARARATRNLVRERIRRLAERKKTEQRKEMA